jgi:rhomboid protease GluP
MTSSDPHLSAALESSAAPVSIFEGTRAACAEASLVLEARGIGSEIVSLGEECCVIVAAAAAPAAQEELARYALERTVVRRRPIPIVPFQGAGAGAALYAAVLIAVAYLTGIQAFGADWLAHGALDARRGGALEWWRAITALTLHVDQAHLMGNLLFGVAIGALAGRVFGPGLAWASILGAGAFANYLDMLMSPANHRAIGASTAVFAALGLLTGFSWRQGLALRDRLKYAFGPLFGGVCLLVLLGAGDQHVDVLGHALGFLSGLALGWAYAHSGIPKGRTRGLQGAAGAAALATVALAWALALSR